MEKQSKIINYRNAELSTELLIELLMKVETGELKAREAVELMQYQEAYVMLFDKREKCKITLNDIYYITVIGRVTKVFTKEREFNSYYSLDEWERDVLENEVKYLFRSHRRCIVNLKKIVDICKSVVFDNGDKAEVSVRKKKALLDKIQDLKLMSL